MGKGVMLLIGAGQIGMAIARRMGYGMKIIVGDKRKENAEVIAKILSEAGFDTVAVETDIASRESIQSMIACGHMYLCNKWYRNGYDRWRYSQQNET
ncbi:MAG: hypothetical protein J1E37_00090 [Prevotella sp.]|nr:hypothetical protein [Prevotella sp.]